MFKKAVLSFLLMSMFSFGVQISLTASADLPTFTTRFDVDLVGRFNVFSFGGQLYFSSDGKFYSGQSRFYFGYYFDAAQGWLGLNLENLNLKIGKFVEGDVVESPYSLFITSEDMSLIGARLKYENDWLFLVTRWMGLTKEVSVSSGVYPYSFPDRGANFKAAGLKLGDFRMGYEEVTVYTGRFFDFEYFASVIPTFFVQYTEYEGRPYRQGTNDNAIMGFFADYRVHDLYIYGQILVDDFNMNRFMFPESYQNPDKIAWAVGCKLRLGTLTIYAHHAGATEYTFEPPSPDNPYGYVHFPAAVAPLGSATRMLCPEENYVGFKYGENTLAFMGGVEAEAFGISFDLGGELVLSGSKSYNNPWHELKNFPEGTHLLDDERIERTFRFWVSAEKAFDWGNIFARAAWKSVENPLKVVEGADGDGEVLVPAEGQESSVSLIFGVRVDFNLGGG